MAAQDPDRIREVAMQLDDTLEVMDKDKVLDFFTDDCEIKFLGKTLQGKDGVLKWLDHGVREVIYRSVELHSGFGEPTFESESVALFLKLLRDADKLDLLTIETELDEFQVKASDTAVELHLLDVPDFSEGALRAIRSHRCVRKAEVKSYQDLKLHRLSWVFDFHFLPSLRMLDRRKTLQKILATLPDVDEVRAVREQVEGYVQSRIS